MDSFETNDLSFAAYLTMHSKKLVSAKKLGKTFKFVFIDDGDIKKLQYQYMSSESSRFDDAVRKLKKIVFGDR